MTTATAAVTLPALPAADAQVAESPAMREALLAADDVAPTPTTVLLLGEPGTGKERLARRLHDRSLRPHGPWVVVDCAALRGERLEAELFGEERAGALGPGERSAGRLERASGGTLLLREVSELPLPLQARLVRALQERALDRPGLLRPVALDARVVATSSRDLAALVASGQFRSDLYYRLNVYPIELPPLRARTGDVLPLAEQLLAEVAADLGRAAPPLSPEARAALLAHGWGGNVRELRNLAERALVRCREGAIEPRHLGLGAPPLTVADAVAAAGDAASRLAAGQLPSHLPTIDLTALERLAIEEALRRVQGNRTHAARLLGIGLRTLRNKLRAWREAGQPVPPADPAERPIQPGVLEPGLLLPPFAAARGSQEQRA